LESVPGALSNSEIHETQAVTQAKKMALHGLIKDA